MNRLPGDTVCGLARRLLRFCLLLLLLTFWTAPAQTQSEKPSSPQESREPIPCGRLTPKDCTEHAVQLRTQGARTLSQVVAMWKQACEQRDASACLQLGHLYLTGSEPPGARYLTSLSQRCQERERTRTKAQPELPLTSPQHHVIPHDDQEAFAWFGRACELGDLEGCRQRALVQALSDGQVKDEAAAFDTLANLCVQNFASACRSLAYAYQVGFYATSDAEMALKLYKQACQAGDSVGCKHLTLLEVYSKKPDVTFAPALARFDMGCAAGDGEACHLAGHVRLDNPLAFKQSTAQTSFRQGCLKGDAGACLHSGVEELQRDVDAEEGLCALDFSCQAGDGRACLKLWSHSVQRPSVATLQDAMVYLVATGKTLRDDTCRMGDGPGCPHVKENLNHLQGAEPELKSQLQQLAQKCRRSKGDACGWLAICYWQAIGVDRDLAAAQTALKQTSGGSSELREFWLPHLAQLSEEQDPGVSERTLADWYDQACHQQVAYGCSNLGKMHELGRGVEHDSARASELYEKACQGGDLISCQILGDHYENGRSVKQDSAKAAELWHRACQGGQSGGCTSLGVQFARGRGVKQDSAKAAELYEQACQWGNPFGCTNLGYQYENGQGIQQDSARAAELYKKACHWDNPPGCANLGWHYEHGRGVKQDSAKAAELYEKACQGGEPLGCYNLGWQYKNGQGVEQNIANAADRWERACQGDELFACTNLGALYENGWGVKQDTAKAAVMWEKACQGKIAAGCSSQAWFALKQFSSREALVEAQHRLELGCQIPDEASCRLVQVLQEALRLPAGVIDPTQVKFATVLAEGEQSGNFLLWCTRLFVLSELTLPLALTCASLEVQQGPTLSAPHLKLAEAQFLSRQPDNARQSLAEALKLPDLTPQDAVIGSLLLLTSGDTTETTRRALLDSWQKLDVSARLDWDFTALRRFLSRDPEARRLLPVLALLEQPHDPSMEKALQDALLLNTK